MIMDLNENYKREDLLWSTPKKSSSRFDAAFRPWPSSCDSKIEPICEQPSFHNSHIMPMGLEDHPYYVDCEPIRDCSLASSMKGIDRTSNQTSFNPDVKENFNSVILVESNLVTKSVLKRQIVQIENIQQRIELIDHQLEIIHFEEKFTKPSVSQDGYDVQTDCNDQYSESSRSEPYTTKPTSSESDILSPMKELDSPGESVSTLTTLSQSERVSGRHSCTELYQCENSITSDSRSEPMSEKPSVLIGQDRKFIDQSVKGKQNINQSNHNTKKVVLSNSFDEFASEVFQNALEPVRDIDNQLNSSYVKNLDESNTLSFKTSEFNQSPTDASFADLSEYGFHQSKHGSKYFSLIGQVVKPIDESVIPVTKIRSNLTLGLKGNYSKPRSVNTFGLTEKKFDLTADNFDLRAENLDLKSKNLDLKSKNFDLSISEFNSKHRRIPKKKHFLHSTPKASLIAKNGSGIIGSVKKNTLKQSHIEEFTEETVSSMHLSSLDDQSSRRRIAFAVSDDEPCKLDVDLPKPSSPSNQLQEPLSRDLQSSLTNQLHDPISRGFHIPTSSNQLQDPISLGFHIPTSSNQLHGNSRVSRGTSESIHSNIIFLTSNKPLMRIVEERRVNAIQTAEYIMADEFHKRSLLKKGVNALKWAIKWRKLECERFQMADVLRNRHLLKKGISSLKWAVILRNTENKRLDVKNYQKMIGKYFQKWKYALQLECRERLRRIFHEWRVNTTTIHRKRTMEKNCDVIIQKKWLMVWRSVLYQSRLFKLYVVPIITNRQKQKKLDIFTKWKLRLLKRRIARHEYAQWIQQCVKKMAQKWIQITRYKKRQTTLELILFRKSFRILSVSFAVWRLETKKLLEKNQELEWKIFIFHQFLLKRLLALWRMKTVEEQLFGVIKIVRERKIVLGCLNGWKSFIIRQKQCTAMKCTRELGQKITVFRIWKEKLKVAKAAELIRLNIEQKLKIRILIGWRNHSTRCQRIRNLTKTNLKRFTFQLWLRKLFIIALEKRFKLANQKRDRALLASVIDQWRLSNTCQKSEDVLNIQIIHSKCLQNCKAIFFLKWRQTFEFSRFATEFHRNMQMRLLWNAFSYWLELSRDNMQIAIEDFSLAIGCTSSTQKTLTSSIVSITNSSYSYDDNLNRIENIIHIPKIVVSCYEEENESESESENETASDRIRNCCQSAVTSSIRRQEKFVSFVSISRDFSLSTVEANIEDEVDNTISHSLNAMHHPSHRTGDSVLDFREAFEICQNILQDSTHPILPWCSNNQRGTRFDDRLTKMTSIITHWRNRNLSKFFTRWLFYTRTKTAEERIIVILQGAREKSHMKMYFQQWQIALCDCKIKHLDKKQSTSLLRRHFHQWREEAIKLIRLREIVRSYALQWLLKAKTNLEREAIADDFFHRKNTARCHVYLLLWQLSLRQALACDGYYEKLVLRRSLLAWVDVHRKKRFVYELGLNLLISNRKSNLSHLFFHWRQRLGAELRKCEIINSHLLKKSKLQLSYSFSNWRVFVLEQKADHFAKNSILIKTFQKWRRRHNHKTKLNNLFEDFSRRKKSTMLQTSFIYWHTISEKTKTAESRKSLRIIKCVFGGWRAVCTKKNLLEALHFTYIFDMEYRALRQSWEKWRMEINRKRTCTSLSLQIQIQCKNRHLRLAWLVWHRRYKENQKYNQYNRRNLVRIFSVWRQKTDLATMARLEEERKLTMADNLYRTHLCAQLFRHWIAVTSSSKHERHLVGYYVTKWRHVVIQRRLACETCKQGMLLYTWRVWRQSLIRTRVLRQMVRQEHFYLLKKVFCAWRSLTSSGKKIINKRTQEINTKTYIKPELELPGQEQTSQAKVTHLSSNLSAISGTTFKHSNSSAMSRTTLIQRTSKKRLTFTPSVLIAKTPDVSSTNDVTEKRSKNKYASTNLSADKSSPLVSNIPKPAKKRLNFTS